jgi:hypothetical protein
VRQDRTIGTEEVSKIRVGGPKPTEVL